MFGDLREHPEWPKLVTWLQKKVDNHRDLVLVAARTKDGSRSVEETIGGHDVLYALLTELTMPVVKEDVPE